MRGGEDDSLETNDMGMIELCNALQLSLDIFCDGMRVPRPELNGYLWANPHLSGSLARHPEVVHADQSKLFIAYFLPCRFIMG